MITFRNKMINDISLSISVGALGLSESNRTNYFSSSYEADVTATRPTY